MISRWLFLLGLFVLFTLKAQAAEKPLPGNSIYNLESQWMTQDGKNVNIASFRGEPAIVAMIYTNCKTICPMIVEEIARLDDAISAQSGKPVHLILFSIDPDRDTPAQLTAFAAAHHLDTHRWTLLSADKGAVQELAATLDFRYRREAGGDFGHSALITLLDRDGVISFQGSGEEDIPALEKKFEALP